MFSGLKSKFEPVLDILTKPFLSIPPDFFSVLALIVPSLAGLALASRRNILAAVLFLGNIFDAFDGYIARKTGKTSKFGGLLDTTFDRIVEAAVLLGAAAGGYVSFQVAYIAMFFSIMVSFVKATATAVLGETNVGKNALSVGIGQRGDRLFILFIGMLFANYSLGYGQNVLGVGITLVAITAGITVVWRMIKAYSLLKK
jgi:phosphatidylglycerophosphate synthase